MTVAVPFYVESTMQVECAAIAEWNESGRERDASLALVWQQEFASSNDRDSVPCRNWNDRTLA